MSLWVHSTTECPVRGPWLAARPTHPGIRAFTIPRAPSIPTVPLSVVLENSTVSKWRRNRIGAGRWRRTAKPWVAALAVIAVMGPVVAAAANVAGEGERQVSEARFEQAANQAAVAIQSELSTYVGKLRDEGAFLAANPDVMPEGFSSYVEGTRLFETMPFLTAVFYIEVVKDEDVAEFVERHRRIDPRFSYIDVGTTHRDEHLVVSQMHKSADSDYVPPVGFDASSIPAVGRFLAYTRATRQAVAASIQDDPQVRAMDPNLTDEEERDRALRLDFYLAVPVYRTHETPDDGEFLGMVVAPVGKFDEVFADATRSQPQDLGFSLDVDLSALGLEQRTELQRGARREGSAGAEADAVFVDERPVGTAGINWTLRIWSSPAGDTSPGTRRAAWALGMAIAAALAVIVFLRTRSARRRAERSRMQRAIIASVADALVVLDRGGVVVAGNPAWERLVASPGPDAGVGLIGRAYLDVVADHVVEGRNELEEALGAVLAGMDDSREIDVASGGPDGAVHWYGVRVTSVQGDLGGAVIVHRDVTARRRTQDDFEFRATHDPLTGLLNRDALEAVLDDALTDLDGAVAGLAVLFVDLDGFKAVNDGHGHALGDEVLRVVAHRLRGATRQSDHLARFGGDEFVVLLDLVGREGPSPEARTAQRILEVVEDPICIGDAVLAIGASVGIAVCRPGETRKQVLHRADHAMYIAKQAGGQRSVLGERVPRAHPSVVGSPPLAADR